MAEEENGLAGQGARDKSRMPQGWMARLRQGFRRLWPFGGHRRVPAEDADWEQLRDAALEQRRDIVGPIKQARGDTGWASIPPGSMGLACSGGGIRSATICLGVAQALEHHDRLLDFDYCSTVSGGNYFGSFLGTLFVPESGRGPKAVSSGASQAELSAKADLAHDALTAQARQTDIDYRGPKGAARLRNPVWWLREHSRYLAPNGTSDYLSAATYLVRNWLAMLYVFALPVGLFCALMIALTSWLLGAYGVPCLGGAAPDMPVSLLWVSPDRNIPCQFEGGELLGFLLSPMFGVVLLGVFFCLAASVAYWLTEWMSNFNGILPRATRLKWLLAVIGTPAGLFVVYWVAQRFGVAPTALWAPDASIFARFFVFSCAVVMTSLAFLVTSGVASLRWFTQGGNAFTADVRRRLTRYNGNFVVVTLVALAFALTDTAGMWTYDWLRSFSRSSNGFWGTVLAALLPIGAWVINQLPSAFSDGQSKIGKWISDYVSTIALVVGVGLFGLLAILLHVALQAVLLDGAALASLASQTGLFWRHLSFALFMLAILAMLIGRSTPFINLSSLHNIYSARLTRAYVGASNIRRLKSAADPRQRRIGIRDSDPGDQLAVDIYQQTRTAAPIHLINVTLNETKSIEKSQMLERDRKGVPLVFAPEGVFVDAGRSGHSRRFYTWDEVRKNKVESLSVGQLCAISGAAASTAMGSRTTLGLALAMTFANIRLGYWWNVRDLLRGPIHFTERPGRWMWNHGTALARTYFYLWNEMTASYSRTHGRQNISDGGHFDNSGAYELLRRGVKTIFVCDNGADPDYLFEDFEQLVRKARIDLGLSINTATTSTVQSLFGAEGAELFLNGKIEDWRTIVRKRRGKPTDMRDTGLFLLFEVYSSVAAGPVAHMVWMKPRKYVGLTQDVVGYGNAHLDFPHETTGDQFFDEAQWESYRALGQCMVAQLFDKSAAKADVLRNLQGALGGGGSAPPHLVLPGQP